MFVHYLILTRSLLLNGPVSREKCSLNSVIFCSLNWRGKGVSILQLLKHALELMHIVIIVQQNFSKISNFFKIYHSRAGARGVGTTPRGVFFKRRANDKF